MTLLVIVELLHMKVLHMIAFVLVTVGAVNWLLYAGLGKDVFMLLGWNMTDLVARVVYGLVGLSGVYLVTQHKKDCRVCGVG